MLTLLQWLEAESRGAKPEEFIWLEGGLEAGGGRWCSSGPPTAAVQGPQTLRADRFTSNSSSSPSPTCSARTWSLMTSLTSSNNPVSTATSALLAQTSSRPPHLHQGPDFRGLSLRHRWPHALELTPRAHQQLGLTTKLKISPQNPPAQTGFCFINFPVVIILFFM